MEITLEQARIIFRALIIANNVARDEGQKIWENPEASDYLKNAAVQQYQKETEQMTKLHIDIAQAFPELTEGTAVSAR